MLISTIIPTIGRSTLSRAVHSVLAQDLERGDFEIIVVNDSGNPLVVEDWMESSQVKILHTNRCNRSIARNTGAAVALGEYLHFLDDDDWILPGAFTSFWEITQQSSASWIHGAFSMVDNAGEEIVHIYPDESGNCLINLISWEWLPLQASIVQSDAFFKVGGFASLESLKGGFEDIHLSRQIALNHEFIDMPTMVTCIRSGDSGSSTNYADIFIQNRQSREIILNLPGSYQRMVSSARKNKQRQGYWYGKIVYYLLVSTVINFMGGLFFTAVGRAFYAFATILTAGKYLWQSDFWFGMTRPHFSRVWLKIKDSEKEIYQNTHWNQV